MKKAFRASFLMILLLITYGFCQENTGSLSSLIPMIVVLVLVILIVRALLKKNKNDEIIVQKEKKTTFTRIFFGTILLFVGICSLAVTFNENKKLPEIISGIFMSLVFITGGIRTYIIVKPTVDKDGTKYADFGKRFWSNTIDGAIYLIAFTTIHLISDKISFSSYLTASIFAIVFPNIFVIYCVYKFQATPGKLCAGILIKTVDKERITFKNALLRSIVEICFSIIAIISSLIAVKSFSYSEFVELKYLKRSSYLVSYFPSWNDYVIALSHLWFWSELIVLMVNKKRRALHDFIANTIVIEKN